MSENPSGSEPKPSSGLKTILFYGLMLAGAGVLWVLIRSRGLELSAPPPPAGTSPFGSAASLAHADTLLHVLIALAVVITVARAIGSIFKYFHQPPVVGEILAGILLGPSLLGRLAPTISAYVLPKTVAPFLGVLSQVGVILYMFLVGLELDPALLRKRGHATIAISHASIVLPFTLGSALALFLYNRFSTSDVPFTAFSLFLGVSMSVTAFPVLARILTDRRIHKTRMGVITLTCAAVDDITAWCLLALVVSVVQARVAGALLTAGLALGYILVMIFAVRPLMVWMSRLYGNKGRLTQGVMALIFVALLLSALATDLIGIHAVFGAFALGAIIPHDSGMARELTDRLEDLVVVLLLPAFFAFTGMRTQIGLVSGTSQWLVCGLIIVVATVGKFGGSAIAARLTGLGWRDSAALGVLMNTRGLMELIVLNIGLELNVISPTLFAMLVIMALVTTFATTPILHLITRNQKPDAEPQPVKARLARRPLGAILVPVSNPAGMTALLDVAALATIDDDPPLRLLALVRRPSGGVRTGLRELQTLAPAHTLVLTEALNYGRSKGLALEPQSVWTDDPAADIIEIGREPTMGWVLLGFHRPVFGTDQLGGVIREVFARVPREPFHAGVVIHSHSRKVQRMVAVVGSGADGHAALELACRIARRSDISLQVLLVPKLDQPMGELEDLVKRMSRIAGRLLQTEVLEQRDHPTLLQKTAGDLVVMGHDLADEIGLPLENLSTAEKCIVVVRGSPLVTAATDDDPVPVTDDAELQAGRGAGMITS